MNYEDFDKGTAFNMGLTEGAPKTGYTTDEIKSILLKNGVTHVLTYGGDVPVSNWTPYGNGIEKIIRFRCVDWETRHVLENLDRPGVHGMWPFAKRETPCAP